MGRVTLSSSCANVPSQEECLGDSLATGSFNRHRSKATPQGMILSLTDCTNANKSSRSITLDRRLTAAEPEAMREMLIYTSVMELPR